MNKIISFWSHRRPMSNALERVTREQGDLICHHEPFTYDHYVHRKIREMPHFHEDAERPRSSDDIRDIVLKEAKKGPLFFKAMSYYVMPHILEDTKFLSQPTHCF